MLAEALQEISLELTARRSVVSISLAALLSFVFHGLRALFLMSVAACRAASRIYNVMYVHTRTKRGPVFVRSARCSSRVTRGGREETLRGKKTFLAANVRLFIGIRTPRCVHASGPRS